MRYLPLFCLLLVAATPIDPPLSTTDQSKNVQDLYNRAQDKNFRFIENANPTLQNLNEHEVTFTNNNGVRIWTRDNNVLYQTPLFNQPMAVYCGTAATTMNSVGFSSISRVATGLYTFTMTQSMPSTEYAVFTTAMLGSAYIVCDEELITNYTKTATFFKVRCGNVSGVDSDINRLSVTVMGN